MKSTLQTLLLAALLAGTHLSLHAQGTAFTYQGRLNNNGAPANGSFDLRFTLFATNQAGPALAGPLSSLNTLVSNGLFSTLIDFGPGVFAGASNWLEIAVSTNGANTFVTLAPRQQVTPVPYALMAANLNGPVPLAALPPGLVTNAASSVTLSGSFSGNGAGLTNLSAAALPAGLALLNANQSFSGTNTFTQRVLLSGAAPVLRMMGQSSTATLDLSTYDPGANPPSARLQTTDNNWSSDWDFYTKQPGNNTNALVSRLHISSAGVLSGNGAGLTNLSVSAAQVTGGMSAAQLPAGAIGSVGTGSSPNSVAVAGRYAYVVNINASALQVFDVSRPSSPVCVGSAATGGGPWSVAVAGRYAYVLNYSDGILQVLDVTTPSHPLSMGAGPTGAGPYSIAVAGRYAYVANATSRTLQVFDLSRPSSPLNVGSAATGGHPSSVTVAGRYAYVLNYDTSTLQVFDVSTPSSPLSVGSVPTGSQPRSVAVAGRYAYVVNELANTLQVFDVSTPSSPVSVGSVPTDSQPHSVAVAGRYAYVVNCDASTLQVFDMGGAYLQHLEAGAMETGTLQTRDTVTVGNNLDVRGGLTASGSARLSGGLSVDNGTNQSLNLIESSSGAYLSAAGVWTSVSDRAAKERFAPIAPEAVLAKVAALPITQWKYKVEPEGVKHLGPVAQDFYGAFGLGDSDKAIGSVDESGVALAAIQGLNQKLEERSRELEAENAELKQRLARLEALVQQLTPAPSK